MIVFLLELQPISRLWLLQKIIYFCLLFLLVPVCAHRDPFISFLYYFSIWIRRSNFKLYKYLFISQLVTFLCIKNICRYFHKSMLGVARVTAGAGYVNICEMVQPKHCLCQ